MKSFIININKTYSEDVKVKAKNITEAKQKAWKKYAGKKSKRKDHSMEYWEI